jgi:hypothetical protein
MGKVYTNIGRGAPKKPTTTTTSVPQRYKDAAKRAAEAKAAKASSGIAQSKPAPPPEGFTRPKNVRPAGAVDLPEGGYGSLLPPRKRTGTPGSGFTGGVKKAKEALGSGLKKRYEDIDKIE